MTPLHALPNAELCPGAPLRAHHVARSEVAGCERARGRLFEPVPHSVSKHILRASAVGDDPLLPRALFVERPSRGARMVRAALGLDTKPQQQPLDAALARDDGLDF